MKTKKKKKRRIPNIIFFPDKKGDLMKMLALFFLIEFSTRLVKFDELNCVKQNLGFKTYFSLNHFVSKLYTHMTYFYYYYLLILVVITSIEQQVQKCIDKNQIFIIFS